MPGVLANGVAVYGLNVNVKCENESLARRRRVQFPFLLEMFVPTAAPAKPHVQNTKCTFGTRTHCVGTTPRLSGQLSQFHKNP